MIRDGKDLLTVGFWWPTVFPGIALCWAGIAVAFISEGLTRRMREVGTR
jgi:ABC-type dipeptide/oligopeptide/nickel transport system permease subunit